MHEPIQIKKFTLRKVAMPMHASFETAFGVLKMKETSIIELEDEKGNIGMGEASSFFAPVYTHEDVDTCIYVIRKFLSQLLTGKSFSHPNEVHAAFQFLKGHPIAKAGVEFAFWDLFSQRQNTSFKNLFGGDKDRIQVKRSIGIKNRIEEVFEEIDAALEAKYHAIKIKIKPGWDVQVVKEIRKKYGDIRLMVDGNSGYRYHDHLDIFKELDQFDLVMIEQPFQEEDLYYHGQLQQQVQAPVCLDESIVSAQGMQTAVELGSCKIVNIKPARISGIVESLKVIDIATRNDIAVWVGGLMETGIGRSINISLASMKEMSMVNDISMYDEFFEQDIVTDSFQINEGYVQVRDVVGLGYHVDREALERWTLEKYVIE